MCKGFREKWINLSNAKVDQNANFLKFIHFFQKCVPPGIQPIYIYFLERLIVRNPLIVETSFIRNRIYKISVQLMKTRIGHKLIQKLMNKSDLKI